MKIFTIKILLFITGIIGALFSLWYIIDYQIYRTELSFIAKYLKFINHGLFIMALILLIFSFFIKVKHYKTITFILIFCGLLYLLLVFSFLKPHYYYIIPLVIFLIASFILSNDKELK